MLSYFDEIRESQNGMKGSSLNQVLTDNHEQVADSGRITSQLPFGNLFRFCKTSRKITKNLCFHLNLRNAYLQDVIHKTIGDINKTKLRTFHLFVPEINPVPATQTMFNESIKTSFTLPFDSWTTDRRTVDTVVDDQLHLGSSSDNKI